MTGWEATSVDPSGGDAALVLGSSLSYAGC